ncbi:hypothetical protein KKG31_07780 [Patescibacteria group bacterium]|nr:hypothetical protein [Patescibacteria group bacterium]MBU1758965.1 hypothetical protein [Patescibacteria group bacterium]
MQGDKPDGYLIKLNQRVDTFNDKDEREQYEADEEAINKKYILILPT